MMNRRKKGAIEMSMQTIIVVVIGITLLTLGLNFVYTTFKDIEKTQRGVTEQTESQLKELFGDVEDPLTLMQQSLTMKKSDSADVNLMLKNIGEQEYEFYYEIEVAEPLPAGISKSDVESWIFCSYCKPEWKTKIRPGDTIPDIVSIDPKGATPGRYRLEFVLHCTGGPDCIDGYQRALMMRLS